jgi:uncharacterized protein
MNAERSTGPLPAPAGAQGEREAQVQSPRLARFAVAALLWALPLAPATVAQGQDIDRYGLVATRGTDTLAVERVTRSTMELRSEVLIPHRARIAVVALLGPDRCARGAVVEVFPWGSSPDATPVQHVSVMAEEDSVRVEVRARDVAQERAVPMPGIEFVLAQDSWAASALMVECALSRGDSASLRVVAFPNLRAQDFVVIRRGDQVTVTGDQTSYATLGPSGVPVRIEVGGSDVVVERVPFEAIGARPAAPNYGPPSGAPYRAEEVRIPVKDGVTLAGTFTVPTADSGPFPAVILVSGGGAQNRDCYADVGDGWRPFREFAHALSSRGMAVLRFDDRGVGESTGDYGSSTEWEGLEDVQATLEFLRRRPEVWPERIALLGHSEGARIAMWAAAQDPAVSGLVMMAGAADPRGAARAQAIWQLEHTSGLAPAARDSLLARLDRQMDSLAVSGSREVYRWNAAGLAGSVRAPVAVFQGETDRQVPADQADSLGVLFRRVGNRDVTVRVFPGVNHLFVPDPSGDFLHYDRLESGRLEPAVVEAVAAWLASRIGTGSCLLPGGADGPILPGSGGFGMAGICGAPCGRPSRSPQSSGTVAEDQGKGDHLWRTLAVPDPLEGLSASRRVRVMQNPWRHPKGRSGT